MATICTGCNKKVSRRFTSCPFCQTAIARTAEHGSASHHLDNARRANSLLNQAQKLMTEGRDPRPLIGQGVELLHEVIEGFQQQGEQENLAVAYMNLGLAYITRSKYEHVTGMNIEAPIAEAIKNFQLAQQMSSQVNAGEFIGEAYYGLGDNLLNRAIAEKERGGNFLPTLDRAREAFEQAAAAQPEAPENFSSISLVYLIKAEHQLEYGEPAQATIEQGIRAAGRALAIDANYCEALLNQGILYIYQARISQSEARHSAARRALQSFELFNQLTPNGIDRTAELIDEAKSMTGQSSAFGKLTSWMRKN